MNATRRRLRAHETEARKDRLQTADELFEHGEHFVVRGCGQGMKAQRAVRLFGEDAVERLRVEVRVEVERGAEALDAGDRA